MEKKRNDEEISKILNLSGLKLERANGRETSDRLSERDLPFSCRWPAGATARARSADGRLRQVQEVKRPEPPLATRCLDLTHLVLVHAHGQLKATVTDPCLSL